MDANADTRHRQRAELPETLAASEPAGAIDQPRRSPPPPDDPQPPDHLDDRPAAAGNAAAADGELTAEEEEKAEHGAADLETLASTHGAPLLGLPQAHEEVHCVSDSMGTFLLAKQFHVSNSLINLTLTSYMIFQGLSPTIFGDLADMAGRRPAYFIGFAIYIGANIGLAYINNYAKLFILRCLQSTGSSGTIALANGVLADIATSAERGVYMGFATAGAMVGPALGPVLGGILAEFLGWRAIFWVLTIMAGVYLIPFTITFPETGQNVVGNGSIPPRAGTCLCSTTSRSAGPGIDDELSRAVSRQEIRLAQAELASERKLRVPNPLKTVHIMLEKDVALILLYNGLVYTAFYDATASLPSQFAEIYGFNDLQIDLCFIPFGVSCCISTIACGKLMDWNYQRVAPSPPTPLHLRHLTRSILLNFLEFAHILATKPADYGAKWDDLRDLFLNAHHLINEYRPHQTRETLILMMEEQVRRGREEVRGVREGRERVEGVLRGLVGSGRVHTLGPDPRVRHPLGPGILWPVPIWTLS